MSRKILIEVEVETIPVGPTEYTTSLRSPFLGGELFFKSTNRSLAEYQLGFIDKTEKPVTEPMQILIKSATDLAAKCGQLKEAVAS